ncbi:hypothetical protein [Caulobacter phage Cr30]|uniref:DprA-like DNA recombination-mediator protein n=1 Tax=Caulobacter phage Cr30 TaxID=1357714 RepID=UPI0004A9B94B|nr:DprA-like DNA recombination-mediator protein [Caulobacter phage Cr30]AGS81032.1 hypothetical protein [Caulobacter phage Cr30]
MNLCKSGGAIGADTLFGKYARLSGHGVIHYHFDYSKKNLPDHSILSISQLLEADQYLRRANLKLQRKFPTRSQYNDNLLRRNYFQVNDTKSVYAVTYIDWKSSNIEGGTAWAVQMFEDFQDDIEPSLYVFDMHTEKWYTRYMNSWIVCNDVPKPQGIYTGIGSRKVTPAGEEAIRKLYGK